MKEKDVIKLTRKTSPELHIINVWRNTFDYTYYRYTICYMLEL